MDPVPGASWLAVEICCQLRHVGCQLRHVAGASRPIVDRPGIIGPLLDPASCLPAGNGSFTWWDTRAFTVAVVGSDCFAASVLAGIDVSGRVTSLLISTVIIFGLRLG